MLRFCYRAMTRRQRRRCARRTEKIAGNRDAGLQSPISEPSQHALTQCLPRRQSSTKVHAMHTHPLMQLPRDERHDSFERAAIVLDERTCRMTHAFPPHSIDLQLTQRLRQ